MNSNIINVLQINRLSAILLFFLLAGLAKSYAQSGSIQGVVRDQKTRETIVGANVFLKGTTIGSTTDLDGNYKITNVAPGTYTLVVSYISYAAKEIPGLKVEKGKITYQDIDIQEVSTEIAGVEVVARKKTGTDISMISSIKQSNLVISGISGQQVERSQDRDASEVVRRVPGVTIMDNRFVVVRGLSERYNTVWLNGVTTPSSESDIKAFSFDAIPSSMLDRMLVFKTPAPELPADFAGAFIQISTKNLPEENKIQVGYNATFREGTSFKDFYSYEGGKLDFLGFEDGARALPDGYPSSDDFNELNTFVDGMTQEEIEARKQRITELGQSFNKIWGADKKSSNLNHSLNFNITRRFKLGKVAVGNTSSLIYSNSNDYTRYYRALYQSYDTIQDSAVFWSWYNDDQYVNTVRVGSMFNWTVELNRKNILEFRNTFNQLSKSNTTYRSGLEVNRSNARIKAIELGYQGRLTYSGQLGGSHLFLDDRSNLKWNLGYAYANKNQPDIRRLYWKLNEDPESPFFGQYGLQILKDATPELLGRLFLDMDEQILVSNADYEHTLQFGSFRPQIKAGFMVESKHREFNARNLGFTMSKSSTFNNDIIYQPIDSIFQNERINFVDGIRIDEKTASTDSYVADNDLLAAYFGIKLPLTPLLTLYGGLRLEQNRMELSGFQPKGDTIVPNIVNDTLDFFPSINLSYNLTEKSLLRLAYGKTINRPEFREVAPFAFYDFEQAATVFGTPYLKNAYIHNFDLRYEFYPSNAEMILIGLFYKKFDNPIETTLFPGSSGYLLRPINVDQSISQGAELEIKKSFAAYKDRSNWLRHLNRFSLLFNASYIFSEVTTEEAYVRDRKRPMQGQSPYIINAGLYYQTGESQWTVTVLYNVIGQRIVVVGTPEDPHVFEQPHHLLDLTFSKKIGERLQIKGGIKDILNEDIIYKQTAEFEDLSGKVQEREQINRRFSPGRSMSLGLTYNF